MSIVSLIHSLSTNVHAIKLIGDWLTFCNTYYRKITKGIGT